MIPKSGNRFSEKIMRKQNRLLRAHHDRLAFHGHGGFDAGGLRQQAGIERLDAMGVERRAAGVAGGTALDAHRIQPFYASLLAQASGVKAAMAMEGETVVVSAQ